MSPTEALAQIQALPGQSNGMVPLYQLRAVLAQVQPEPVALDRDKARDVLRQIRDVRAMNIGRFEQFLDALAACVRPAPPQTIDRDAPLKRLYEYADVCGLGEDDPTPAAASDIIALVHRG